MLKRETALPKHVNDRRRASVSRFTLLATLVYQIPFIAAYLAKYYNLANYDYSGINSLYIAVLITNLVTLAMVQLKKQVTKRFVFFMLFFQIICWAVLVSIKLYLMTDLRMLTLISGLMAMIFVFTQSRMYIAFILIGVVIIDYLAISYIGITYMGQAGSFGREVLVIIVFFPVSLFIAYMCNIVQKQSIVIKESRNKIKTTFAELETTHSALESFNERMIESLHYAEMIQQSLLPGIDRLKTEYPDSMIIWMPKDIVGGDIFYTYTMPGETILVIIDCTGHGVPGAFLTMIAYSEIRKIIMDERQHDPALILKSLNIAVKKVLHKNDSKTMTDDGMDAAVCKVDHSKKHVTFSSARLPLFYVKEEKINIIKGDKQSIGYCDSDENFDFTNHIVENCGQCSFYLKTDGFTDQLGGENRRRFGTKRFRQLIMDYHKKPFQDQRKKTLQTLLEHQGKNDQVDDITLIAFRV